MKASDQCIHLIRSYEGCRLVSYQDQAGVWTIGWGTIIYRNGIPVKTGERIDQITADGLLNWEINLKSAAVTSLIIGCNVNQNQFDALVDFAYNLGVRALTASTLLKKLKVNPDDPLIHNEFIAWNKVRIEGKLVANMGLTKRRLAESTMYFNPLN